MLGGSFKERGGEQEIGRFHVVLDSTFFVEIGVSSDTVHLRPNSAADRGVVDVGNRRHQARDGLVEPVALPLSENGHPAFRKVVGPKPVEHDYNSSLEGTLLRLSAGERPQSCGRRNGCSAFEYGSAAWQTHHDFAHFRLDSGDKFEVCTVAISWRWIVLSSSYNHSKRQR